MLEPRIIRVIMTFAGLAVDQFITLDAGSTIGHVRDLSDIISQKKTKFCAI